MRTTVRRPKVDRRTRVLGGAALACNLLVAATWLAVLYHVVEVVGGQIGFVFVVGGAVALAVFFGSTLGHRDAVLVGLVLLALGLAGYLRSVPPSYWAVMSPARFVEDMVALGTGYSVLQMTNAGTWATAVAPGPAFLVAYFGVRGEHVRSAAVSGATLGFFVLTGDAGTTTTLLGVVGAAGAVGFAALARHGGSRDQVETLAAALAVMILASATVTAVPGGSGGPLLPSQGNSVQADLVTTDDRASIGGSIRLSPEVKFVVESDEPAYWRAAAYDRFTGYSWVRTGGNNALEQPRDDPPGDRRAVNQMFTARTDIAVFAAAARPQSVTGVDVVVTAQDTLELRGSLDENESYTVRSLRPTNNESALREATRRTERGGPEYPADVRSRYLQTPASVPERVAALTANIAEGADSDYAAAKRVEQWLQQSKGYSTDVSRPDGSIVESFLFEMDRGYCVYFATTMVQMLRTQGIPARYVVGYTSGQRVAEDEWVVRGYDSHAWVEMYVPGEGWVQLDPTPGGPRRDAEQEELSEARESGVASVDVNDSDEGTWTPTPEPATVPDTAPARTGNAEFLPPGQTLVPAGPPNQSVGASPQTGRSPTVAPNGSPDFVGIPTGDPVAIVNGNTTQESESSGGGFSLPSLPPPELLAVWSVLFVGVAAGVRRTGAAERAYRAVWLRWQPGADDNEATVRGAYDRVEFVLERQHREREAGETVREYLDAVDAPEAARQVAALREKARYAGGVSSREAERARKVAAAFVSERTGVATTFNRLLS